MFFVLVTVAVRAPPISSHAHRCLSIQRPQPSEMMCSEHSSKRSLTRNTQTVVTSGLAEPLFFMHQELTIYKGGTAVIGRYYDACYIVLQLSSSILRWSICISSQVSRHCSGKETIQAFVCSTKLLCNYNRPIMIVQLQAIKRKEVCFEKSGKLCCSAAIHQKLKLANSTASLW